MSLAQFMHTMQQIGQQPSLGQRFMQGQQEGRDEQDRQLKRQQILRQAEMQEDLHPFAVLKAQREALAAGQPNQTDLERRARFIADTYGVDMPTAANLATGRFKQMTDPNTGNIYIVDGMTGRPVDPNTAAVAQSYYADQGESIPEASPQEQRSAEGEPVVTGEETAPPVEETGPRPVIKGTKEEEREQRRREREEDQAYRESQDFKQEVRDLGAFVQKEGLATTAALLDRINKQLAEHAGEDYVPGRGYLERFIARPIAELLPMFSGPEGTKLMQNFQFILNDYIKTMAGTAVSGTEEYRVLRAMGADKFDTPESIIEGLRLMHTLNQTQRQTLEGMYSPEALDEYEKRSGHQIRPFSIERHVERDADGDPIAAETADGRIIYRRAEDGMWVDEHGFPYLPPEKKKETPKGKGTPKERTPKEYWEALKKTNPDKSEEELLEWAIKKGRLPEDFDPSPPARGTPRNRGGGARGRE